MPQLTALYVATHKHGVNGITLHWTAEDAYAELVEYLCTGNEHDPKYADDAIPTALDERMEWCEERAIEQGVDWYCTEVEIPPVASN